MTDRKTKTAALSDLVPDTGLEQRRTVLRAAGSLAVASLSGGFIPIALAEENSSRPKAGHRLVLADEADKRVPLQVSDIPLNGKPVFAFPYDLDSKTAQDGSRLNKVALVKVDAASLSDDAKKFAVDGVLAFSSVCTHQGCDVTEFVAKEHALMCFCHFSKFDVLKSGAVAAGPAPRDLPYLPLKVEKNQLVVAGGFSSTPGVKKTG
ncbi:ubiquinol-cytochrome c reductase iron-sulfur subunit [Noviherbaspirillum suwonense]|uniref:Rieske Fe-S protein n=1 Tax=Noviherbaspirillum suwonense TaxID=1224511 RepID=A0ABY1QCI5_9BURK|nr:Rieske 2Fe-2S domain-containing protein [Noviherbaspirillum suwonense]SMP67056.1 Rieske Fe-S protein [Noviherbaspirillum suwonense]